MSKHANSAKAILPKTGGSARSEAQEIEERLKNKKLPENVR